MQCIRVYLDTGARPQLFNAIKYSTAFPVGALFARCQPAHAGQPPAASCSRHHMLASPPCSYPAFPTGPTPTPPPPSPPIPPPAPTSPTLNPSPSFPHRTHSQPPCPSTSHQVILLSAVKYHVDSSEWRGFWKPLWLAAALLNSAYSYYWDVERDWEISWFSQMGERVGEHPRGQGQARGAAWLQPRGLPEITLLGLMGGERVGGGQRGRRGRHMGAVASLLGNQ